MKTLVVVGGGITGLSTMYYIQKAVKLNSLDVRLLLVEAEENLGGKIKTVHNGDFIFETGAESIIAGKENTDSFIKEINLQDQVVYNEPGKSFLHTEDGLKRIPEDSMFGIPMSVESLAKSELISLAGKVEALKDFYTKNETFTKKDSIISFLKDSLGEELVDNQIEPILSGVFSGEINDLTIDSTLPFLVDYKENYGGIIRGLEENKDKFKGTTAIKYLSFKNALTISHSQLLQCTDHSFLSFKNGLSTMVDRLEEILSDSVEIMKGVQVTNIAKESEHYKLTFANDTEVEADYIVLSTPDSVAKQLLNDSKITEEFSDFENKSLISIYLGFDLLDNELPNGGTGFITTKHSNLKCNACVWTSRKWTHRNSHNHVLMRLFYNSTSPHYESLHDMTDVELEEVALIDIKDSLGITKKPITSIVTKWQSTMPHYHANHNQNVRTLQKEVSTHYPNIFLAGSSYYGASIPDCIASGEHTAEMIIYALEKKLSY